MGNSNTYSSSKPSISSFLQPILNIRDLVHHWFSRFHETTTVTIESDEIDFIVENKGWIVESILQGTRDAKFVAKVRHKHREDVYVMKRYTSKNSVMSEFLVLSQCPEKNQHLLVANEWFYDNGFHYFLYDRVDVDLFTIFTNDQYTNLRRRPLVDSYMHQIVRAVMFLHSRLIIHYDLKFENVVMNLRSRNVRLIDFECAQEWDSPKQLFGTRDYMAPEILLHGQIKAYEPGMQDIWCLGILLAMVYADKSPCKPSPCLEKHYHSFINSIPSDNISRKCLEFNPVDRCDIYELARDMGVSLKNLDK